MAARITLESTIMELGMTLKSRASGWSPLVLASPSLCHSLTIKFPMPISQRKMDDKSIKQSVSHKKKQAEKKSGPA